MIRVAAALVALCFFTFGARPQSAGVTLVGYVRAAIEQGDLASASAVVARFRQQVGNTPEALEALSWIARGELSTGNLTEALKEAEETKRLCETALANRRLDDDPHLPIALGTAYEVEAQALSETRQRSEAVELLNSALRRYAGTSIVERLQKNLNVLTLQGKPMPALQESEWIGAKPAPQTTLQGKVVLLFFWAHWCPDCKAEAPVLARLAGELESKGLVIIGPTKLYGYTPEDDHATPAEEKLFIEKVYSKIYSQIPNLQVPVSSANFERFGASTTPTIVVADRHGIVRLYHPGIMDERSLRAAIDPLLVRRTAARASR